LTGPSTASSNRCGSSNCHFLLPELAKLSRVEFSSFFSEYLDRKTWELVGPAAEYDLRCKKLTELFRGHPKPFDAMATARLASARYAKWITDADLAWSVRRAQVDEPSSAELTAWPSQLQLFWAAEGKPSELTNAELASARQKLLTVENPIGKAILEDSSLDGKSLHRTALTQEAQLQGTRVFIALRQFELGEGRLPDSCSRSYRGRFSPACQATPFRASRSATRATRGSCGAWAEVAT